MYESFIRWSSSCLNRLLRAFSPFFLVIFKQRDYYWRKRRKKRNTFTERRMFGRLVKRSEIKIPHLSLFRKKKKGIKKYPMRRGIADPFYSRSFSLENTWKEWKFRDVTIYYLGTWITFHCFSNVMNSVAKLLSKCWGFLWKGAWKTFLLRDTCNGERGKIFREDTSSWTGEGYLSCSFGERKIERGFGKQRDKYREHCRLNRSLLLAGVKLGRRRDRDFLSRASTPPFCRLRHYKYN